MVNDVYSTDGRQTPVDYNEVEQKVLEKIEPILPVVDELNRVLVMLEPVS